MGYLDNTSVTVDAVLTKLGRERLANGDLDITKFALGDDEIDYDLYDTSHNLGSAYYGEAIGAAGKTFVSKRRTRGATGRTTSGPATGLKLAATVNGATVTVTAYSLIETTTTTLTVTGIDSGGSVTIPITVNKDPALAT